MLTYLFSLQYPGVLIKYIYQKDSPTGLHTSNNNIQIKRNHKVKSYSKKIKVLNKVINEVRRNKKAKELIKSKNKVNLREKNKLNQKIK